jgi:hypothetical protein
MLITSERHLRLVLGEYTGHYDGHRPHRPLPPAGAHIHPPETNRTRVLRRDRLGGLIHEYAKVA